MRSDRSHGDRYEIVLGQRLGPRSAARFHDLEFGSGQMVSQRETDRIIWRDLLAFRAS